MFTHTTKVISAGILLIFCLTPGIAPQGQVIRSRARQRVGRVALPTPPFNPNAGVLGSPKARGRTAAADAPRRPVKRGVGASNRNPRPGTPRKRRVRRGR